MFEYELGLLEKAALRRRITVVEPLGGMRIRVEGMELLSFCSNDYLGLATHPALKDAALSAMERYGFGSGASRLVSGTNPIHVELEKRISDFKKTEAALLLNSGYAANTGVIPALLSDGDVVFSDSLNHASIIDGCRLCRAEVFVYRHKDLDHLEGLLKKCTNKGRRLIVTDGVFSMDGDIAPLPGLASLAERYGALLMVDDAHATGVLGDSGRGTAEHFAMEGRVHIVMGTLGKALGSFGAFIAGDRGLIDYLINKARSFMFSTALPPAVSAASIAAIDIVERHPELRARLWNARERLVKGLLSLGIDVSMSETPIVPVVIKDSALALRAAEELRRHGIFAPAIRPPSVPTDKARIRITVSAAHSDDDIDRVLEAFSSLKKKGYFDYA